MFTELLLPDYQFKHLTDIDVHWLKAQKIDLLILDVNNTLVKNVDFVLSFEHKAWLHTCLSHHIKIVLCSNNPSSLVQDFAQAHDLDVVRLSLKPFTFRIRQYLKQHGLIDYSTMVIGDQMFTDVLLGKLLNVKTALVQPLSQKDHIITKYIRKIEAYVLKNAKR